MVERWLMKEEEEEEEERERGNRIDETIRQR